MTPPLRLFHMLWSACTRNLRQALFLPVPGFPQFFKSGFCIGIPFFGSATKPLHRLATILRNALTLVICQAEIKLRLGDSLLGGETIPLHRLDIILRNALALVIHHAEIELRLGDSLLGGAATPLRRLAIIPWNTLTIVIHHAEI